VHDIITIDSQKKQADDRQAKAEGLSARLNSSVLTDTLS
jgi:hypothetical protein